jgi:hypothetical protein
MWRHSQTKFYRNHGNPVTSKTGVTKRTIRVYMQITMALPAYTGRKWVELYLYSPYMPSWRGQRKLYLTGLYGKEPTFFQPAHFSHYIHRPLSYIIAFISTNTCTAILSSYIHLHMFRLLISHHQGDQVYKHRLHIHYDSWFTFNVHSSSYFNIEFEPTIIVDV